MVSEPDPPAKDRDGQEEGKEVKYSNQIIAQTKHGWLAGASFVLPLVFGQRENVRMWRKEREKKRIDKIN